MLWLVSITGSCAYRDFSRIALNLIIMMLSFGGCFAYFGVCWFKVHIKFVSPAVDEKEIGGRFTNN